jgi:hypothetical protein
MTYSQPITPHALTKARRAVRQALAAYRAARSAGLEDIRTGAIAVRFPGATARYRRELAFGPAIDARFWWRDAVRKLAAAEARPLEKGSAMSPAAWQRHLARRA